MTRNLAIREAFVTDIPMIEALIEIGYRGAEGRNGWTSEIDLVGGARLAKGEMEEVFACENAKIFVAILGDQIVGVICVTRDGDWIEFGKFAVIPNMQGHGIGRKLIKFVENFAKSDWKASKLNLCVLSVRDELFAYYERCGFVDTKIRMDFRKLHPYAVLKDGIDNLEIIVMEKEL